MVTVPITFDPTFDYAPGFAGMKFDAQRNTDVVTVPCGAAAQPFGTVVGYVEATGISELPVVVTRIAGVAVHEQQTGSRRASSTGYAQYEAMSVMRGGRIWGLASGTCTKGAVAKFTLATGAFSDAGAATLPTAKFLSGNLTVPSIAGEATHQIVLVELHSPQVDNIGAS